MAQVTIADYTYPGGYADPATADAAAREHCRELEAGNVIFFPRVPFDFPAADREFLLAQKQSGLKIHKNISYRPQSDALRGAASDTPGEIEKLHAAIRRFSQHTIKFVDDFLRPYAGKRKLDFASFRPVQEQGRDLPTNRRNDLMHVDAFPTRPTRGDRILRVFTNINPVEPRIWETVSDFPATVKQFADGAGLRGIAASARNPFIKTVKTVTRPVLKAVGYRQADRTAYDKFMLRFHDYLKTNDAYQKDFPKSRHSFPPGSTWMCYTDQVGHAALSGQFALEQTFVVPLSAMVTPDTAPLRVLEAYCGVPLGA